MNPTEALQALNAIQALTAWLAGRGLARDRIQALLDNAAAEGRDLTTAEVQTELDQTAAELDATENLINQD